jgi:hypothetical protein
LGKGEKLDLIYESDLSKEKRGQRKVAGIASRILKSWNLSSKNFILQSVKQNRKEEGLERTFKLGKKCPTTNSNLIFKKELNIRLESTNQFEKDFTLQQFFNMGHK